MLILDKFFLKYEGGWGRGHQIDPTQKKTTLINPSLTRVKKETRFSIAPC